jgi:hypothetical protein
MTSARSISPHASGATAAGGGSPHRIGRSASAGPRPLPQPTVRPGAFGTPRGFGDEPLSVDQELALELESVKRERQQLLESIAQVKAEAGAECWCTGGAGSMRTAPAGTVHYAEAYQFSGVQLLLCFHAAHAVSQLCMRMCTCTHRHGWWGGSAV